jgi:hypothetical protein
MSEENEVAEAIKSLAFQVKYLGTGENGSPMGAVEFLATELKEGLEGVASAIYEHAEATRNHADAVHGAGVLISDALEGISDGRGMARSA